MTTAQEFGQVSYVEQGWLEEGWEAEGISRLWEDEPTQEDVQALEDGIFSDLAEVFGTF